MSTSSPCNPKLHRAADRGMTLVELLIGLVVAAMVIGLGVPQFQRWIAGYQLKNHAQRLAYSMTQARGEAIKRDFRVNLCKSIDRRTCAPAGGWDGGWIVFVDVNRNGQVDVDEPVVAIENPPGNDITVTANRPLQDYVSYTGLGHARMLDGALQMGTFVVCRSGFNEHHVVLAHSGRVRVDRTKAICP